jgi:hypothetical protein
MVFVQKIDNKKFNKYRGGSINNSIYKPLNSHQTYLKTSEGGFIQPIIDFVSSNKDLISNGASALANVAGAAKSFSDVIKTNNELELIKKRNKKNKPTKEIELTQEQKDNLNKLVSGNGFAKL